MTKDAHTLKDLERNTENERRLEEQVRHKNIKWCNYKIDKITDRGGKGREKEVPRARQECQGGRQS